MKTTIVSIKYRYQLESVKLVRDAMAAFDPNIGGELWTYGEFTYSTDKKVDPEYLETLETILENETIRGIVAFEILSLSTS